MGYNFLSNRLKQLWGLSKGVKFIDLRNEFILAKFSYKEDMHYILEGGPWVVAEHYITLRRRRPGFASSTATIDKVAAWVRLPDLPIEFFDVNVLTKQGT